MASYNRFLFFLKDVLQQLKMRLFDGDGVPIESTVALTAGRFKYAGELMAMSIAQGGPSPNFLSPIIYDVIPKGLSQTSLSVDMIQNTQLKGIATQVCTCNCIQAFSQTVIQQSYGWPLNLENQYYWMATFCMDSH